MAMMAASASGAHGQNTATQQSPTPPVVINAKADSTTVTMGGRMTVRVELVKNSHNGVFIDNIKKEESSGVPLLNNVEVRDIEVDSTDLGNGRVQVNYNYTVQPFDVGTAVMGPFNYALNGDTTASSTVTVKVLEPEMPKEMRDSLWINPMEGTVSIPSRWYDFIPAWWPWVLLGLAGVAIIVLVMMLYKRNGPTLIARKKVIPPHIIALKRLAQLKQRKLAESSNVKEYYTELTDILRQYLDGRFGIYAREMTSSQIIDALHERAELETFIPDINELLTTADFVKFAKQNPGINENVHSFATVYTFVDSTRPVEEEKEKEKKSV